MKFYDATQMVNTRTRTRTNCRIEVTYLCLINMTFFNKCYSETDFARKSFGRILLVGTPKKIPTASVMIQYLIM